MKNILVPVDFSPYSLSAAKSAAKIAAKTKGRIHLLHLIPEMPVTWSRQSDNERHAFPKLEKKYTDALSALEKFSKNTFFKDCQLFPQVQGGVVFEQIERYIKNHNIDLVVIGAHGSDDKELRFIGSTAQRVLRNVNCAVLSVKKDTYLKDLKKIVFVSDFEEHIAPALHAVKNLAYDFKADIDLVHINTPSHFEDDSIVEKRIKKYVSSKKGTTIQPFIENNQEREVGILYAANKHKADIIAMATHARAHKATYLMSTTETILFHSNLPVLSFVLNDPKLIIK